MCMDSGGLVHLQDEAELRCTLGVGTPISWEPTQVIYPRSAKQAALCEFRSVYVASPQPGQYNGAVVPEFAPQRPVDVYMINHAINDRTARLAFKVRPSIALSRNGHGTQWGVYVHGVMRPGDYGGAYMGHVLGYTEDPACQTGGDYWLAVESSDGYMVCLDGSRPPQSEEEQHAVLESSFAACNMTGNPDRLPVKRQVDHQQWPGMWAHLINDARHLQGVDNNMSCRSDGSMRCTKLIPAHVDGAPDDSNMCAEAFWPYGDEYWDSSA
jgi:hypothetical protein